MQNLENLFSCRSEICTTLTESLRKKSDVVRGQVVRSVKEQVDSVIDPAVIRLYCLRSASTLWQALASVARSSSSDTEFLFLFLFAFSFSFLFFFSCAFF